MHYLTQLCNIKIKSTAPFMHFVVFYVYNLQLWIAELFAGMTSVMWSGS